MKVLASHTIPLQTECSRGRLAAAPVTAPGDVWRLEVLWRWKVGRFVDGSPLHQYGLRLVSARIDVSEGFVEGPHRPRRSKQKQSFERVGERDDGCGVGRHVGRTELGARMAAQFGLRRTPLGPRRSSAGKPPRRAGTLGWARLLLSSPRQLSFVSFAHLHRNFLKSFSKVLCGDGLAGVA